MTIEAIVRARGDYVPLVDYKSFGVPGMYAVRDDFVNSVLECQRFGKTLKTGGGETCGASEQS